MARFSTLPLAKGYGKTGAMELYRRWPVDFCADVPSRHLGSTPRGEFGIHVTADQLLHLGENPNQL